MTHMAVTRSNARPSSDELADSDTLRSPEPVELVRLSERRDHAPVLHRPAPLRDRVGDRDGAEREEPRDRARRDGDDGRLIGERAGDDRRDEGGEGPAQGISGDVPEAPQVALEGRRRLAVDADPVRRGPRRRVAVSSGDRVAVGPSGRARRSGGSGHTDPWGHPDDIDLAGRSHSLRGPPHAGDRSDAESVS